MHVEVKYGDYQSPVANIVGAGVMFLIVGISVVLGMALDLSGDGTIWGLFSSMIGFFYYFELIFVVLGIAVLVQLLLPPKTVDAVLLVKDSQFYMGQQISYMVFKPLKQPSYMNYTCPCFTQQENKVKVGKVYRIVMKRYNKRIVRIDNPDAYANEAEKESETPLAGSMSKRQIKELEKLLSLGRLSVMDLDEEMFCIDESYMRFAGVFHPQYVDISQEKRFCIKSSVLDKYGEVFYYLADGNDQMLYQFRTSYKYPFKTFVSDYNSKPIAVFETQQMMLENKIVVRLVNDVAFSIRYKATTSVEFEVTGIDFAVIGRAGGSFRGISFIEKNGNMAAEINPLDESIEINKVKITVNNDYEANTRLLMLIAGVYAWRNAKD